jgi:transcriptional regulator with XRE-family HTH domain
VGDHDDDLNLIVAANLRKHRQRLGLSQEAFADLCGVHRTYIGALERGEGNLTLKTLAKIEDALDLGTLDLLRKK